MTQPQHPGREQSAAAEQLIRDAKLVIFDFDGVIADSEVLSLDTLRDALSRFGLTLSLEDIRHRFLGSSLKTISAYVQAHGTGDAARFATVWEAALFARFAAELAPVAHVLDLIDGLTQRKQLFCIASSGTLKRIGIALDALGAADRFEFIFSAEQVARGKPAPDLFTFAADQLAVPAQDCIVIEDSPHGVQAAKSAGMRCIGFTGGSHVADRQTAHDALLREAGAEVVLPAFAGLTALFKTAGT